MDSYQKEFIQNLKMFRKEKNISQAKLSELCNVSTGTIGNIECGSSKPSFDLILTIARVLNIHPSLLFSSAPPQFETSNEDRSLLLEFYQKLKLHLKKDN